jgi:hypothetical protein
MPMESPVVLAVFTVGLVPSEQPVSVTPAAVSVSDEPLPVAAVFITKVIPFVTEEIVALPAMFVPLMLMPGISPVVLAHVTVVVPFVVQLLSTTGVVWLPVPPRNFTSAAARLAFALHAFMLPGIEKLVPVPVNDAFAKIS